MSLEASRKVFSLSSSKFQRSGARVSNRLIPQAVSQIPFLTGKMEPLGPLPPLTLGKKGPKTPGVPEKVLAPLQPTVTASPSLLDLRYLG